MKRSSTRGFSLIEVLSAAAIFGIGLAAIFSAFGSGASQLEHQRHLTHAIHLTEARLEEILLWSTNDAQLAPGRVFGPVWYDSDGIVAEGCGTDTAGIPALSTTCRYRVTWSTVAGDIKGIRVVTATTAWNERGALKSVSFSTQRR